ncbi:MAG: RNA-binding S4 domain-containing protein [Pseudomonadota bacterium]
MNSVNDAPARQRVDKWLWQARFFKTRSLAGEVAGSGRLRLNGKHCTKPAQTVAPGDELSFPQAKRIRAIRVEAIGTRRGPAAEAQTLYTDLDPAPERDDAAPGSTVPSDIPDPSRRPTKRGRREIAALKRTDP